MPTMVCQGDCESVVLYFTLSLSWQFLVIFATKYGYCYDFRYIIVTRTLLYSVIL